ncbi:MAG: hypothetical protein K2F96_04805 [Muribaculaceae bacterium]|nr:hypothetical protein [Muribaculaceae bacterium]
MKIATDKKTIGCGLIVLFSILLVNVSIARIPLMPDTALQKIFDWWFLVSQIIQAGAVLFIAFNRQSQSSTFCKVGACLYAILMLMCISNRLVFIDSGKYFIYFPGVSEYINSLLFFAPGLLLLVWGLSKLWLPIKLVTTLSVVISVIIDIICAKLIQMYQNYSFEQKESLYNFIDILSFINVVITVALVVLSIVWICLREKTPSV